MPYQFDVDKIQDELQGMCEHNADVQHNVNNNKSFARFESDDEINEISKNEGKNIVVVVAINGRRVGDKDDKKLRREIILRFAVYAENESDVPSSKKVALHKAEEIMFDFMMKMEKKQEDDIDQDSSCSIWRYLQPENFAWDHIPDQPWLVNHYGWDLTIPFGVYMPAYNAAKWND